MDAEVLCDHMYGEDACPADQLCYEGVCSRYVGKVEGTLGYGRDGLGFTLNLNQEAISILGPQIDNYMFNDPIIDHDPVITPITIDSFKAAIMYHTSPVQWNQSKGKEEAMIDWNLGCAPATERSNRCNSGPVTATATA